MKEKYEFSDGEYQVIAPKSIDDILYEGDTLHHCVNKTDTYFDRIVSKESYILFLREKRIRKYRFIHWKLNQMELSGKNVRNLIVKIRTLIR